MNLDTVAKVMAIITSCKTSAQNNVAYRVVMNYEKMNPHNNIVNAILFEMVDKNLNDIFARAGV